MRFVLINVVHTHTHTKEGRKKLVQIIFYFVRAN